MAGIVATRGPRVHPGVTMCEHCINGRPRVLVIQRRDAQAAAASGYSVSCADQLPFGIGWQRVQCDATVRLSAGRWDG